MGGAPLSNGMICESLCQVSARREYLAVISPFRIDKVPDKIINKDIKSNVAGRK